MRLSSAFLLGLLLLGGTPLPAGYEQPSYIDGCTSANGRFTITAEQVVRGKTSHGPHEWRFILTDNESGKERTFDAAGVQGGQVYGQLFVAPDGKTFAFWNHVTMYWATKSHMHASGHKEVINDRDDPAFRTQPVFRNRLIIYNDSGKILKTLHVADFLTEADWRSVLPVFNRVEWLRPHEGVNPKTATRKAYAYTDVSPDYARLSVRVGDRRQPRRVTVSLIDGTVLQDSDADLKPLSVGDDEVPHGGGEWIEAYVPSLDPVRVAGTYTTEPIAERFPKNTAPKKSEPIEISEPIKVADGFGKADTPSWMPKLGKRPEQAGRWLFTDLEANALYALPADAQADSKPDLFLGVTSRGRVTKGHHFYGLMDGALREWDIRSGDEPNVLVAGPSEVAPPSLNDLVVSSRGLIYFTTLKDPERGRLTLLDPQTKRATVLFDGEEIPELSNPNGVALDRNQRFLYVGISNYKQRKHSGIYAFPLAGDGTITPESVRATLASVARIPVKGPDGIAVDRAGNIWFTAGGKVEVWSPWAQRLTSFKIPKGSGTNLAFGGDDGRDLLITTNNAIYRVRVSTGVK